MTKQQLFLSYPVEKLKEAISITEQIADLEARLSSLFSESSPVPTSQERSSITTSKRRVSSAVRAKMIAGQRARWARKRGEATASERVTPAKSAKRGKGLTAAGRKKLSEAMKARWAARKRGLQK